MKRLAIIGVLIVGMSMMGFGAQAKPALLCANVYQCFQAQPKLPVLEWQQLTHVAAWRDAYKDKLKLPNRYSGGRAFVFSPRYLQWAAYNSNGKLLGYGRANGGSSYCPDLKRSCRTPRGSFKVYSKGSPHCRSSKFPLGRGGAPMPYCTFFYRGYAIHGSPGITNRNSSHGCIRVTKSAAVWLARHFFTIGTRVKVLPY